MSHASPWHFLSGPYEDLLKLPIHDGLCVIREYTRCDTYKWSSDTAVYLDLVANCRQLDRGSNRSITAIYIHANGDCKIYCKSYTNVNNYMTIVTHDLVYPMQKKYYY